MQANDDHWAELRAAHLTEVRRAIRRHAGRCVASHESAAVALGLPVFTIPAKAQLTRLEGHRRNDRVRAVAAALPARDVCVAQGIPVTSPARTAVDVARMRPFLEGLIVADAVMRRKVSRRELLRVLDGMPRWPGKKNARHVVLAADGRSESAQESIVRGRCLILGLEMPELQVWIKTPLGWVRVDFYWEAHRLIGEADGMVKYAVPGDLAAEKLRQEALEEEFAVTRWTWAQSVRSSDEDFAARLLRAFARGDRLQALLHGMDTPGPALLSTT